MKIQIRNIKYNDVNTLDELYANSSFQTKFFFHPNIFKIEYKNSANKILYILSRISFILCTNEVIKSFLLRFLPFFIYVSKIAVSNCNINGFAYMKVIGGKASLGIFIPEKYQKRGIGKLLMNSLINEAIKKNINLQLTVLESNLSARSLYESVGFTYTGEKIFDVWMGKPQIALVMDYKPY